MQASSDTDMAGRPGNYTAEQWWVAAFSSELVQGQPLARRLLDQPVVLYRRADGLPAALLDRCPHRWTPLSMGSVSGNDIVCGYHGFRFTPGGQCVDVPSQDVVPRGLAVRAYPVLERPPFIWIWMGEAAAQEPSEIPDYPWLTQPGWSTIKGLVPLKANYMALRENVLDLTHFGYAHASSFEITDWDKPPEVARDGMTVSFLQRFDGALAPMYGGPTGIGTQTPARRIEWGRFLTPAIHVSGVDITHPDPERQAAGELSLRFTHVTTPQSATETLYFWTVARNHGRETEAMAALERAVIAAFDEDREILEAIQRRLDEYPRSASWPEASVKADQAALTARRIVAERLGRPGLARQNGTAGTAEQH